MTTQQARERRHAETCPCPTPELHVARYGVLDVCPNCEGCPCLISEVPVSDPSAPQVPVPSGSSGETAQDFAVIGDWLVLRVNKCTCGGAAVLGLGHEQGCGWDVVAKVDEVAPALERFWRDRIADELDKEATRYGGPEARFGCYYAAAARIARGVS